MKAASFQGKLLLLKKTENKIWLKNAALSIEEMKIDWRNENWLKNNEFRLKNVELGFWINKNTDEQIAYIPDTIQLKNRVLLHSLFFNRNSSIV